MKRDDLLGIAILVVGAGSLIGYFTYDTTQDPWIGFSCEEAFDFEMSPEHEYLTHQQHFEFHQYFDPFYEERGYENELDC